jgi:hypothetical protein
MIVKREEGRKKKGKAFPGRTQYFVSVNQELYRISSLIPRGRSSCWMGPFVVFGQTHHSSYPALISSPGIKNVFPSGSCPEGDVFGCWLHPPV